VLLTVHGSVAQADLSDGVGNGMREREKGFAFTDTSDWEGVFPEWYQTTYHTKEYILDRYSKYFNVLGCIPKGMNNHQDVVLLEKA
jgi:hypothetical protein